MTKTLSFAAVHFTVAFSVGYALTGSAVVGGLLAVVEPACNTVAYHFHEKAWVALRARVGRRGRVGEAVGEELVVRQPAIAR